jgi:hypothetical protein
LISEAPPGWKRTEADECALRPIERALKIAWKSSDPQRFDHALEVVAAAFRAAFAAWYDRPDVLAALELVGLAFEPRGIAT